MFCLEKGCDGMLIVSSILLLFYLAYYILYVYPKKQRIQAMMAKMMCMTLGMTSSLLIGVIVGVAFQGEFAFSTILSIFISFVIALVISSPFGVMASMEALCSSLMGGMMGAMTGEMLSGQDMKLLLFFMDSIFILSMAFVFLLIKREERKNDVKSSKRNPSFSIIFTIIIPIVIIGAINLIDYTDQKSKDEEIDHSHMHHS
jgi:phosphoglycerol transferase MdoB-like AlkP superfamily enzyme